MVKPYRHPRQLENPDPMAINDAINGINNISNVEIMRFLNDVEDKSRLPGMNENQWQHISPNDPTAENIDTALQHYGDNISDTLDQYPYTKNDTVSNYLKNDSPGYDPHLIELGRKLAIKNYKNSMKGNLGDINNAVRGK